MIPQIINFVWVPGEDGRDLPEWAERNVEEFRALNPECEIKVHGKEVLLPEYVDAYNRCRLACQKSDILRYSALERNGGWYFDVDYWPLRPIDDIIRAYMLSGEQMLVTHSGRKSGLTGSVIAAEKTWRRWREVRAMCAAANTKDRNAVGPVLINNLAKSCPEDIVVGSAEWFNGVDVPDAPAVYKRCVTRGNKIVQKWVPETHGQLPFVFHLWAGTNAPHLDHAAIDKSRHCVVYGKKKSETYPWLDISEGMAEMGYSTENVNANESPHFLPDVAFIWNGLKGHFEKAAQRTRDMDGDVIFLEHGFFDRQHYCQADRAGILHRASWVRHLKEPAPACGAERLDKFYPDGLKPFCCDGKYILIVGQVPGDTQMLDSEIKGPVPLQRVLWRAIPDGVKCYFRPHPMCSNVKPNKHHRNFPRLETQSNEVSDYVASKGGIGLKDALKDAMFIITVNSNAITEAIAAGVPALAFGPSTAIAAGVAKQTTVATVADDIKMMLRGWHPEQAVARNYMEWLAARQWTKEEFKRPELLEALIEGRAQIEISVEKQSEVRQLRAV